VIYGLPKHVAIIMDGNGRWAKQRNLPRLEGHRAGVENIRHVVEIFAKHGIRYLTLFAFSTENWQRPQDEVKGLLKILNERIDREVELLHEKNIRVWHLGRLDRLPTTLQRKIRRAIELTQNNTRMTFNVAFDYGGRTEILDAVHRILNNKISPDDIHENSFREYLYLPELPDPDLIIRTGGEMRLSNFLLWQAAYSELYFTEALWPNFDQTEIDRALAAYESRRRRFGKV